MESSRKKNPLPQVSVVNLNKVAIITLDAHPASSLQWGDLKPHVLKEIASGKTLLWHLDFGLFSRLPKPLENPEQFLTLTLAMDHFKETIWKEYHRFSQGLLLYRGSSDFSKECLLDHATFSGIAKGLHCRNVCANYLTELSANLPDEIQPYLLFDHKAEDSLLHLLAGDPDLYGRILPLYSMEEGFASSEERKLGVLMPPTDEMREEVLRPFANLFETLEHPYKKIPESRLISCWNGLDKLIYSPRAISSHGKRLLNGFEAAGGELIPLDALVKR